MLSQATRRNGSHLGGHREGTVSNPVRTCPAHVRGYGANRDSLIEKKENDNRKSLSRRQFVPPLQVRWWHLHKGWRAAAVDLVSWGLIL